MALPQQLPPRSLLSHTHTHTRAHPQPLRNNLLPQPTPTVHCPPALLNVRSRGDRSQKEKFPSEKPRRCWRHLFYLGGQIHNSNDELIS